MKLLYKLTCKATILFLFLFTLNSSLKAQTTLVKGDIAFTGYFGNGVAPSLNDQFSFVLLTNITSGTVINFTDNAWNRTSPTTGAFRVGEGTVTYTSGAAYNAGTEIHITITSGTTATATLVGGASAGTATGGTMPSLSTNGDQVVAYQGTAASPTFISAIHMNVYSVVSFPPDIPGGDAVTTTTADWDGNANTSNSCGLPGLNGSNFLTNGVDALWIPGSLIAEKDNARFNCTGPLNTAAEVRTAVYNVANWLTNNDDPAVGPPSLTLPTGCSYIVAVPAPSFTLHPVSTTICAGTNTSFTITATGATSYQWQVDNGGGFANLSNDATYSNVTTVTLNITNASNSLNGYLYRCVATNGTGPTNSNSATLTITPLPVNPTLLLKTPATITVADGTPVSATFNSGSGGTGCADDFRYTTDGGSTYLPYTPGSNISTTGLAAGSGTVSIEGRRANCSSLCQNSYVALASWIVSPLPAGATTLNAGDIAFSGYIGGNNIAADEFSFVLLRNIGPGTTINFTNNGWLSTNVFRTGEETVTWTSPSALSAGTEIKIAGLTASKSGGGAAGIVTGAALSLGVNGDQVLAYRGSAAAPTFISAIHTNVYTVVNGDPVTTTAAAWDGTANTNNASALPLGLTTGDNAIWIGTLGAISSEFDNSKFGNCSNPAVAGSVSALRAALNNQANWTSSNGGDPAIFSLPTGCNYLSILVPTIDVTGTPLSAFTSCSGTASAEQNFVVSGIALTTNITINAPTGFEISTTSGNGFASSISLTQSGGAVPNTTIYVRLTASATGTPAGNITLVSTGVTTINVAVTGTVNPLPPTPTITAGGPTTFCTGGSVTLTSSSATGNLWSTAETTQSIVVTTAGTYTVTVTSGGCTSAPSAGTTVTVNPLPATPTITAGGPTTFCTGGIVTLTSSSATGNLWSTAETTQSIVVTTAGTYTVTVTSGGCTSAPSAGTTVTVDAIPTTSNAGPDGTACVSPGTFTMAANAPVVGTGAWTQTGGPGTAIIFTPSSPTTNIGNITTSGTYTFRWTITSGSCPASFDEMNIVVSGNPALFTLAGGGTFCPGSTTLTGPVDPNYTYTWQRSLSGIANPNSFTNFGGTTSTQDVTSSGNYRLIVTNQFGCSTSDTTPVSMADFVFNGSLAAGDAQQTGRLNRFATLSTCAAPKSCPLTFTTTGARFYDSYNITNPRNVPVCATIGLRSECGTSLFNVAYLGSFDPNATCTNYLADPGSSFPGTGYMEVTIPANATIVVVVHEVNPGTGCAGYQLTVDVTRETGVTVNPSTPICTAIPVTLTAPVASSYSWNPSGNTTQAIIVSPAVTTEYFVTLGYGNNGCTGLDSATVVVNQLPTTADAGLDAAVCALTYTLAGNTPTVGTGTWTQVAGPGTSAFTNANLATSDVTVTANGVYTFRWTIATGAPCPNSSQDDVVVNFAGTPSVADAGLDKTACVSPARATMTAAVPTVGTGVWTQVAGPVTANIISPNAPNTIITGLNTIGTYTFRWTVSNNPCPSNFDEVNVVVNSNPASFTITGGGTFCPDGTTLAGPVDPNYTYQWGKSYLTTPFTGVGTAQTLAVTSSGIYELVVTNQFGCSASATTVVNAADYVFTGSLGAGDAVQTGRLNRFAAISTCAAPKACPNTFTTAGSRVYDSYTITNPRSVPVCAVIGLNSGCGTAVFSVAYSNSYDPNNLCNNYLADPGSSPSSSIFYEATIPANGTIVVVVHEVNPGTGCANYSLTVDVPRDLSAIVANPPSVTCASTSTLTAPVANSYLWTPGGATTRSVTTPPLFVDTKYNVTLGYGNNGCTREDSVTVAVTSLPPTISCPANITQSNTTGQCGRIVTYSTIVGGLPTPTETYSFSGATTGSGGGNGSGSFFAVGTTTVTVTATNSCGNTSCSFTVTINDTEPAAVITGTIGSCYPSVAAAEAAALAATSATDNCPGALTEVAATAGTCSAVITVTTTDVANNSTTVTYNTRIDNTAPVITCPAAITVCGPSAVPAVDITLVAATDNCPGAIIITHQGDVSTPSTTAPYNITRTYRATDGCGNFAECTQIITVNPIPNAVATPASQTICSGTTITTIVLTGAVSGTTFNWTRDNIAITGIAASGTGDISGALTNLSSDPVTVTFTITPTANGCPGTPVTATVVVNPIPNAAATPASQTICSAGSITTIVLAGYGSAIVSGTTFNWTRNNTVAVTGIAASGTGNISGSLTNTTNAPVTVTFTITPIANGCPGTPITATVLVNPTPNAVATPASQTVCSNAAIAAIILSGNVSGTTYSWTRNNTVSVTGIVSGSGNITGTLVNTTTVQQTVTFTIIPTANGCPGTPITATVIVNPIPTITCPANITVNNTPGVCGAAVTYPPATATGVPAPTITYSVASGSVFPVGLTTVTATATNACGTVTCTFTVRVNDVQLPVITCPANIVVNTTVGACTAIVPYVVTATDNCPGVTTALVSGLASGAAFPLGVTTVTHRATDASGNTATCSFTVTVNDAQVPVISAQPANRTVCTGTNATFTVTATNAVTYQWQSWNGSVWSNITGATGATLTLTNVTSSMASGSYRVLVNGLCTVVTSNQATLYVNPLPTVSIAATPLSAILPGQTTSIAATTNPSGGNFVWFKNGAAVPGTGAVYGPITIDDIGTYRTVYTDPNGCVATSGNVVITGQASDNMWVYPNPNTGQFNVRYYNQTGETATLKVFDYLGQEVYSQSLPQGIAYSNTVVNLQKPAAEVYIVKVVTSTGRELAAKRIVVYH